MRSVGACARVQARTSRAQPEPSADRMSNGAKSSRASVQRRPRQPSGSRPVAARWQRSSSASNWPEPDADPRGTSAAFRPRSARNAACRVVHAAHQRRGATRCSCPYPAAEPRCAMATPTCETEPPVQFGRAQSTGVLRCQRRSATWISSARPARPQCPSSSSIVASRWRIVFTCMPNFWAVVLEFWLQSR